VPVPDPDVALKVVEPELVPQTKPLELTVAPPSVVTFPPDAAEVPAILDIAVVVSVGAANVVKVT
jgi:hypothetical protein